MTVREANGNRQKVIRMGMDGWPNSRKRRQGSAEKYEPLGEEKAQVSNTHTDVKQTGWNRN